MTLNTIALELVPPNVEHGRDQALEDAAKVLRCSAEAGLEGRIGQVGLRAVRVDEGRCHRVDGDPGCRGVDGREHGTADTGRKGNGELAAVEATHSTTPTPSNAAAAAVD